MGGKELNSMTMMKREVNSIWSRVRSDVDVDDLIFGKDERENSQR